MKSDHIPMALPWAYMYVPFRHGKGLIHPEKTNDGGDGLRNGAQWHYIFILSECLHWILNTCCWLLFRPQPLQFMRLTEYWHPITTWCRISQSSIRPTGTEPLYRASISDRIHLLITFPGHFLLSLYYCPLPFISIPHPVNRCDQRRV